MTDTQQLEPHPVRCGCGGQITPRVGCQKYLGSALYDEDVRHETIMRSEGFGFGVFLDVNQAVMSAHLQDNGLTTEQSEAVLSPVGENGNPATAAA